MIFDGGVEIGLLQPHFCLAGVWITYIIVAVAALYPETAKPKAGCAPWRICRKLLRCPLDLHMILKFAVAKQSLVSDCLTTGRTIFAWRNCVLLSDSSPRRLLRKASNRNLGPESY